MIILIDAYNVLKQRAGNVHISILEQNKFLDSLSDYSKRKNHELIAFFDGGLFDWPAESKKGNLTVKYSGLRLKADDLIKQSIKELAAYDTLLVSSDRELCEYAAKKGISCLASAEFAKVLATKKAESIMRVVRSREPVVKFHEGPKTETDVLMEKASKIILYKDNDGDDGSIERSHGRTLSKKEKKILKISKKL